MVSEVLQNKWVRAVGLLGAIIAVSVVLYLLSSVLVPLFFAFIVAYVFDPVIDWIEEFKIKGRNVSRVAAIVTLVGTITLAAIVLPIFVVSTVIRQADDMNTAEVLPPAVNIPAAMGPPAGASTSGANGGTTADNTAAHQAPMGMTEGQRAAEKLEEWLALDSLVRTLDWVDKDENGLEPENPDSIAIIRRHIGQRISEDVGGMFLALFPQFKEASTSLVRMLGVVGDTFLRMFLFIGNFVLFAFVAIYLLKDYDHIVASSDDLIPHRYRPKVREVMGRIDRQLRSFLRGQFTVCCCLGTMYAIGLTLAGTPFALPLAIFGAVASFVPYLGLILTIGPAVILTLLYHSGTDGHLIAHLAGVLATFAIAQFLEGNFLTPKIVGSQVGLGPVWVILAIMVFSSALGFVGLLLAVPIAAVLKVLAEEALTLYRGSAFFASSGPPAPSSKRPKSRKPDSSSSATGKGRGLKKV